MPAVAWWRLGERPFDHHLEPEAEDTERAPHIICGLQQVVRGRGQEKRPASGAAYLQRTQPY